MTVTHSVTVTRNGWGEQLAWNAYMDIDVTDVVHGKSWTTRGGGENWTLWSNGWTGLARSVVLARHPTDPHPVARTPGESTTYHLRARLEVPVAKTARLGVTIGPTVYDVAMGEGYTDSYGTAVAADITGPAVPLTAGTWIISANLEVPATLHPDYILVGPFLSAPRPSYEEDPDPTWVDYVEMFAVPTSDVADLSQWAVDVAIKHGRQDTSGQPEASTTTIDLSADRTDAPMPTPEVGGTVEVTTSVRDYGEFPRFAGRVTDVTVGWDDAGEESPDRPVMQLVAASVLGELGRRIIGDVPWPQETDGLRIKRVIEAAGFKLEHRTGDDREVQILPRDVDAKPALEVAHAAANSANGILWQTRDGRFGYAGPEARRGTRPDLTVDSCDLLITPQWARTTDGLVNQATIIYGVAPEGGERPSHRSINAASRARYGRYETSQTTDLADQVDAEARAEELTTRGGDPVWIMTTLPVDVAGLEPARYLQLLELEMNSLVLLTGLPEVGTAPTRTHLWVEGWSETLRYGEHEMDLSVSGYCRTSPYPRFDDAANYTWDTIPGAWDDATCFGPLLPDQRWMDLEPGLRWAYIPEPTTWESWS